jgi:hypothetical protein
MGALGLPAGAELELNSPVVFAPEGGVGFFGEFEPAAAGPAPAGQAGFHVAGLSLGFDLQ